MNETNLVSYFDSAYLLNRLSSTPLAASLLRWYQKFTTARYKLDKDTDIDANDDGLVLNLRPGWRFSDDPVHVRDFDTMAELRLSLQYEVAACNCADCERLLKEKSVVNP